MSHPPNRCRPHAVSHSAHQRDGAKSFAERHAQLAVVQHDAAGEARAERRLELAQSTEVGVVDGRRGLHFDARHRTPPLDRNVHFGAVLVPVVVEGVRLGMAAGHSSEFLADARLEELSQQLALGCEVCGVRAQQRARQPGVAQVQLRRLDESLEPVAVPGLKRASAGTLAPTASRSRAPSPLLTPKVDASLVALKSWAVPAAAADSSFGKTSRWRMRAKSRTFARHDGLHIVPVPFGAPAALGSHESGRVSSGDDPLGKFGAQPLGDLEVGSAVEEGVEEPCAGLDRLVRRNLAWRSRLPRPRWPQLRLRQRMQPKDVHPSGERVRELRDQQDVGRAREDEAPRGSPTVDGGPSA